MLSKEWIFCRTGLRHDTEQRWQLSRWQKTSGSGGFIWAGTDRRIDKAIDDALARAGFQVVPLDQAFKTKWDQAKKDGDTVAAAGAWISDGKFFDKIIGVSARTKAIIALGEFDYSTSYRNALGRQAPWQQALRKTFKKVDFIALPTLRGCRPGFHSSVEAPFWKRK